jgi:hypothetical protein
MKEAIDKILIKYCIDDYHWKPEIARDIDELTHQHYMEFVMYMIYGEGNELYASNDNKLFYQFKTNKKGEEVLVNPKTLKEVYQYWKKEINKED